MPKRCGRLAMMLTTCTNILTKKSWIVIFSLAVSSLFSSSSSSSSSCCKGALRAVPGLNQETYSKPGDINIGALMWMTFTDGPSSCSKRQNPGAFNIEFSESLAFAVKLINDNPNLLPNVTLGFVQVNECGNGNVALAKALSFLHRISSDSSCPSDNLTSSTYYIGNDVRDESEMQFYDVIGVVGPVTSASTISVSKLFSTSQIPMIGCLTTSDELSNKYLHPYFLRVTAPDKYQTRALLSFIHSNGWSYISLLYALGAYGENAFENFKQFAPDYGICIATSHRVDSHSDFHYVVADLLRFQRARVVILFVYKSDVRAVFDEVRKFNATGHFIWVGGDAWSAGFRAEFQGYEDDVLGSFSIAYHSLLVLEYYKYLREKARIDSTTNPWFKPTWEGLTGCSFGLDNCELDVDILATENFTFEKTTSLYIDAMFSFAHAAHNLISDVCPQATGIETRRCIKGNLLLQYLQNVSFLGYNGLIKFNEEGDVEGMYEINQVVFDYKDIDLVNVSSTVGLEAKTVALYDVANDTIRYTGRNITWEYFKREGERFFFHYEDTVPESVCSEPCKFGEYKIQREVQCCWDCYKCRDNEKLVRGNTSCQVCPPFTWPDPGTVFTTCRLISPTYPTLADPLSVLQMCLGLAALACTFLVAMGYVYFRDTRIIKATSRELSALQLAALFVGYVTVILFQTPPTHGTCGALYFLFCLSFACLYSPLLVKTIRIYRIFRNGAKSTRRPRFVSPQSQLIVSAILIGIQVFLCLYTYMVCGPTAKSTQPIPTEQFVELSCDMTFPGLASFLTYNLLLISLCSTLAFKTRKLPDNFNESKFISMCVSTTLVIWVAFVPTYFTSSRSSIRVLLLSLALLLNQTVALISLFVPKIYASVYVDTADLVPGPSQTNVTTLNPSATGLTSRITPLSRPNVEHS